MKIIAVQCLSTLIASCSRAFLFFPSFTLSPSFLSSLFFLTFPLTFLLSASIPILSTPPSFPTPNPYNLSISSSTSLLSIPPFLVCLLPIQPLFFHSYPFFSAYPSFPSYPSIPSYPFFPSHPSIFSYPSSSFHHSFPCLPPSLPLSPFFPHLLPISFLPLLHFLALYSFLPLHSFPSSPYVLSYLSFTSTSRFPSHIPFLPFFPHLSIVLIPFSFLSSSSSALLPCLPLTLQNVFFLFPSSSSILFTSTPSFFLTFLLLYYPLSLHCLVF